MNDKEKREPLGITDTGKCFYTLVMAIMIGISWGSEASAMEGIIIGTFALFNMLIILMITNMYYDN